MLRTRIRSAIHMAACMARAYAERASNRPRRWHELGPFRGGNGRLIPAHPSRSGLCALGLKPVKRLAAVAALVLTPLACPVGVLILWSSLLLPGGLALAWLLET